MQNAHSVAGHWDGHYDEAALRHWAERLRQRLEAPQVSLGLVFMTPQYFAHAAQVLELLRVHAQVPLLAGCSSQGLISGDQEWEETDGLVLGLYYLPDADLKLARFSQEDVEARAEDEGWHNATRVNPAQTNGWLVFADPFHMDCEAWLRGWNAAYPGLPILGGLASGDTQKQTTQIYVNGDVHEDGGVGISIGGQVALVGAISQGCTPIGETWTITKADRNFIYEIANRPAYEVLAQTFNELDPREQQQTRGNLFLGLVTDEYRDEFRRGDFLIRNVIGADPNSGVLAVAAWPRAGQTIQFQRRDANSSTEDIVQILAGTRDLVGQRMIFGGCLCSCNGRGARLFGQPHHDARHVQESLGPLGIAGFFCNGELGPVGGKNFLHGYTASLALFVEKSPKPDA